jgi:hypothetical protein
VYHSLAASYCTPWSSHGVATRRVHEVGRRGAAKPLARRAALTEVPHIILSSATPFSRSLTPKRGSQVVRKSCRRGGGRSPRGASAKISTACRPAQPSSRRPAARAPRDALPPIKEKRSHQFKEEEEEEVFLVSSAVATMSMRGEPDVTTTLLNH